MRRPLWLQKPRKEEFMENIDEKIERDGEQRPKQYLLSAQAYLG